MDKVLTPQQEEFLAYYTDPNSETWGNAYQSAIKAKYSPNYAESITVKGLEWLEENVGKSKRLKKAEKNLEEVQNLQVIDETGKVLGEVLRERNKVDLFIAETVGKSTYSKKTEIDANIKGEISLSKLFEETSKG